MDAMTERILDMEEQIMRGRIRAENIRIMLQIQQAGIDSIMAQYAAAMRAPWDLLAMEIRHMKKEAV